ncbi:PI-actitoxin-Afv2a-like [Leptopilina boulardi]|uniref:PI-actitoxin-Afv2a-like n=1 Tax=Leptopilina boulardi TaxID=63433 RepID=UPI0021F5422A|nr:PI-actitoxin-Afv2a-like [Leptopilina boulardi]
MHYKFFTYFLIMCIMFIMEFDQSNGQPRRVCSLGFAYGTCNGRIWKLGYNSGRGACEFFIYSGCGGNENNFNTKVACENYCRGV